MKKRYECKTLPSLSMGGRFKFAFGSYVTEDEEEQAIIEKSASFANGLITVKELLRPVVEIQMDPNPVEPEHVEPAPDIKPIFQMTRAELVDVAQRKGLKVEDSMTRAQVMGLVKKG